MFSCKTEEMVKSLWYWQR